MTTRTPRFRPRGGALQQPVVAEITKATLDRAIASAVRQVRPYLNASDDDFDQTTGRFIADGRPVPLRTVLRAIAQQQLATQRVIMRYTQQLLRKQITLARWERLIAQVVADAIAIKSLVGSGGVQQFADVHLDQMQQHQDQVLTALHQFAIAIQQHEQTPNQINARARSYSRAGRTAFHIARHVTAQYIVQHTEARRGLDPLANHCPSCLRHSTNGEWRPIEDVVPAGVDCECGPNCQCTVTTRPGRRRPAFAQIGRDRIADLL